MPKHSRWKGTGITRYEYVEYRDVEPGSTEQQESDALITTDPWEALRGHAEELLRERGLPTGFIVRSESGGVQLDEYVIDVCGHEQDSAEGYAARFLCQLHWIDLWRRDRNRESAIANVLQAGYELGLLEAECRIKFQWEPQTLMGMEHSKTQAAKGHKGAEARWQGNEARDTVSEIITKLAARCDALGDQLPPEQLWAELYADMDSAGMAPREHDDPPRYECDGLSEPITKDAFRRRIQRARK